MLNTFEGKRVTEELGKGIQTEGRGGTGCPEEIGTSRGISLKGQLTTNCLVLRSHLKLCPPQLVRRAQPQPTVFFAVKLLQVSAATAFTSQSRELFCKQMDMLRVAVSAQMCTSTHQGA